jgi:hypothetical protein
MAFIIYRTLEVWQRVSMICERDEFEALLALATTGLLGLVLS